MSSASQQVTAMAPHRDGLPCQESWGSSRGAHAAGDLDPRLGHADFAFGGIVIERNPAALASMLAAAALP